MDARLNGSSNVLAANIGGGAGQPGIQAVAGTTTSTSIEYTVTAKNATDVTLPERCADGGGTKLMITGSTPNTVWSKQILSRWCPAGPRSRRPAVRHKWRDGVYSVA